MTRQEDQETRRLEPVGRTIPLAESATHLVHVLQQHGMSVHLVTLRVYPCRWWLRVRGRVSGVVAGNESRRAGETG